jgi:DNA polymerase-3 subunit beta
MRLTVDRNEFAETISWAARTIPQKTNSPVMGGVLLEADGDLTISAFDYEVSTRGTIPADVQTPGRCLAGGRLLAEITRNLPAAPITLELDGSRLTLSCGPARFQFPLLDVEDYPTLPEMPPTTGRVDSLTFADAVSKVAFAADPNKALQCMRGVFIQASPNELVMVGSDSYRVAARWLEWRSDAEESKVLPHVRHLTEASKALAGFGEIEVGITDYMLGLATSRRSVVMRSITEQFLAWERMFQPNEMTAEFPVGELVSTLRMISPTLAVMEAVRITLKAGRAVLEGGTETSGSVDLECVYDGPEFTIAYNPRYLIDAVNALEGDTVTLGFPLGDAKAALRPTRITGKDSRHEQVVMPVRL